MRIKQIMGVVAVACAAVGCGELGAFEDVLDNPIANRITGLALAGVNPASDFRETGNINFSMIPEGEEGSSLGQAATLASSGMKVEVKNDDGTYSECDHEGSEDVQPKEYGALTLLLDGSGSMELAYPPDEYGDVCVTCPHDPKRERIDAARALVERVSEASPESPMSVAEFGPDPTDGFAVTRLHSDFATDPGALADALDRVEGYDRVGTPLYDSLAEMIGTTDAQADELAVQLAERGDIPWEEREPNSDEAEAEPTPEEGHVGQTIVVLSDGLDNESEQHDLTSVIELANQSDVAVYAIGLGPASASAADPDLPEANQAVRDLQKLARETGGFYAAANNPAQLRELYDTLARALTEGYDVETYKCIPKPTHDTPEEDCEVPPVGSRVDGRVSMGDVQIPWATIAN
jgi:hypothetical protein